MTAPQNTTTLQAVPVLVVWEVGGQRVEVKPNGAAACSCALFKANGVLYGVAECQHTKAVEAERQRRGLAR
jgi:hypothetical protein